MEDYLSVLPYVTQFAVELWKIAKKRLGMLKRFLVGFSHYYRDQKVKFIRYRGQREGKPKRLKIYFGPYCVEEDDENHQTSKRWYISISRISGLAKI